MPTKPVRNSAKAIIIRDGTLLCTKNHDLLGDFYLLPGGGQNHGETLVETVKRECLEETGARIEAGKLCFVREYISANHELAKYDDGIHQIEFMFLCQLLQEPDSSSANSADIMQTGVVWLPISKLADYRFYPAVLAKRLQNFLPSDFPSVYLGDTL